MPDWEVSFVCAGRRVERRFHFRSSPTVPLSEQFERYLKRKAFIPERRDAAAYFRQHGVEVLVDRKERRIEVRIARCPKGDSFRGFPLEPVSKRWLGASLAAAAGTGTAALLLWHRREPSPPAPREVRCDSGLAREAPTGSKLLDYWQHDTSRPRVLDLRPDVLPQMAPQPGASSQPLSPTDPFVLQCLLEGFLDRDVTNSPAVAFDRFMQTFPFPTDKKVPSVYNELRRGKEALRVPMDPEPEMLDVDVRINRFIDHNYVKFNELARHDVILCGGYQHYDGGHAITFRVQVRSPRITLVNSGEGLSSSFKTRDGEEIRLHPRHPTNPKLARLYCSWSFEGMRPVRFRTHVAKLIAATRCPYIGTIHQALQYQVYPLFLNGKLDNQPFVHGYADVPEEQPALARLWRLHRSNWAFDDQSALYCAPALTATCTFHSFFWQLVFVQWQGDDEKAGATRGIVAAMQYEAYMRQFTLTNLEPTPPVRNVPQHLACLKLLLRIYEKKLLPNVVRAVREQLRAAGLPPVEWQLTPPALRDPTIVKVDAQTSPLHNVVELVTEIVRAPKLDVNVSATFSTLSEAVEQASEHGRGLVEHQMKFDIGLCYLSEVCVMATLHLLERKAQTKEPGYPSRDATRGFTLVLRIMKSWSVKGGLLLKHRPRLLPLLAWFFLYIDGSERPPDHPKAAPEGLVHELLLMDDIAVSCWTISFVRKYLLYGFQPNLSPDSVEVRAWQTATEGKALEHRPFFFRLPPDPTPVMKAFWNFICVNEVYEGVAALSLFLGQRRSTPILLNKTDFESLEDRARFVEPRPDDGNMTFVEELLAGHPLQQAAHRRCAERRPALPPEVPASFVARCNRGERLFRATPFELTHVPQATHLFSYATDVEDFTAWRTERCKQAFKKVDVVVPLLTVHSVSVLRAVLPYLLWLWPDDHPWKEWQGFTLEAEPELSLIASVWLTKDARSFASLLRLQLRDVPEYCSDVQKLAIQFMGARDWREPDAHQACRLHFARSLLYRPELLHVLLDECQMLYVDNARARHGDLEVYEAAKLWPPGPWMHAREHGPPPRTHPEFGLLMVLDEKVQNRSWLGGIAAQCTSSRLVHALWQHERSGVRLHVHVGNEVLIFSDKGMLTQSGEAYQLALPAQIPPCMRPWLDFAPYALALPLLSQKQEWTLLLASAGHRPKRASCVFARPTHPWLPISPEGCFLYPMQACGVQPLLTHQTRGLRFLFSLCLWAQKSDCVELLLPVMQHLDPRFLTDTRTLWPSPTVHHDDSQREVYTQFLDSAYDPSQPDAGAQGANAQLWTIRCESFQPLSHNVQAHLDLLIGSVHRQRRGSHPQSTTMDMRQSRAVFEALAGKIVRQDQLARIHELQEDLQQGVARVRIALMGLGKSKVIVPVLVLAALLNRSVVSVVQPTHLVAQMRATLDELLPFLAVPVDGVLLLSDVEAKQQYLDTRIRGQAHVKRLVLFDEVDAMYNPLRSELNRPSDVPVTHPLVEVMKDVPGYCRLVVQTVYEGLPEQGPWSTAFWNKFAADEAMSVQMVEGLEYGLSRRVTEMLVVPYGAVNTPLEGSVFSDVDLTALLSCRLRRKHGLTPRDILQLQTALTHMRRLFGVATLPTTKATEGLDVQRLLSVDESSSLFQREDVQRFFLENVLLPQFLAAHGEQFNVSFVDLMAPDYSERRAGFSGTRLMHMPEFEGPFGWDPRIVPDVQGERAIWNAVALKGAQRQVEPWNGFEALVSRMQLWGANVLIDAAALLRDMGQPRTIVERWYVALTEALRTQEAVQFALQKELGPAKQPQDLVFVYLDEQDVAREWSPKRAQEASTYRYRPDVAFRWLFDQKHTIGTDLELAPDARAATLVASRSRLTDVAQAVFRLRGVATGDQSSFFVLQAATNKVLSRRALYMLLQRNDEQLLRQMCLRHLAQNIKALARSEKVHVPQAYLEKVPYYRDELQVPNVATKLGRALGTAFKSCLHTCTIGVDTQAQHATQIQTQVLMRHEDQAACEALLVSDPATAPDVSIMQWQDASVGKPWRHDERLVFGFLYSPGRDYCGLLCVLRGPKPEAEKKEETAEAERAEHKEPEVPGAEPGLRAAPPGEPIRPEPTELFRGLEEKKAAPARRFAGDYCKLVTVTELDVFRAECGEPKQSEVLLRDHPVAMDNDDAVLLLALSLCGRTLALHEAIHVIARFGKNELVTLHACLRVELTGALRDYGMREEHKDSTSYFAELLSLPDLQLVQRFLHWPVVLPSMSKYLDYCRALVPRATPRAPSD